MRVRRLELQGFKSFKDKTIINFDDGITGIVGPNGCGKSNVVDAFFWVMGEQNARMLRGLAMDDLIFSGSDRSPAAASAEVTMVMEMAAELSGPNAPAGASSTDTATQPLKGPTREVAITRKLYRTGESDYFINKQACRLRDIQELFMDTGVGSRGYSIIQQGQIQKIVQAKPEERRTMIEEVAGIVKYKARRKESLRKLESTQQNLLRVTDIVTEIEGQKRQMERQAEKARKYREWKERLQSIELSFNALKWDDYSEKIQALTQEIETLHTQDIALTTARESEEVQISNKRLEATSAQKVAEENQDKWLRVGQALNDAENDHKYSQKNLLDLRSLSEQLTQDVDAEQRLVESVRAEHEQISQERESILGVFAQAESERQNAEQNAQAEKRQAEQGERELEQAKDLLARLGSELGQAQNQSAFAQTRLEELQATLARLEADRSERENTLSQAQAELSGVEGLTQSTRLGLENMRAAIQASSQEISTLQADLDTKRRILSQLGSEQARVKATLHSLEEQKRRHEDSDQGVKAVFQKLLPQKAEWQAAVKGTLADSLNVEKGYETAIETALGEYLDLILTASAESQLELSEALRSSQAGRAAFANLSLLASQAAAASTATPSEAQSLANFVSLQANATSGTGELLAALLKNIFVVANLSTAQSLSQQYTDCAFVTTQGELVRGGWYLVGGDQSTVSGSVVGRNREISELADRAAALAGELEQAQTEIQTLDTRLQEAQDQRRRQEEEARAQQEQLAQKNSELATWQARVKEAERGLRTLADDLQRAQNEQSRQQDQRAQAESRSLALAEKKLEAESSVQTKITQLSQARLNADTAQQVLADARVKEAGIIEQKNSVQSRYQTSSESLRQRLARIEGLLEQVQKREAEAQSTVDKIAALEISIQDMRQQALASEQEYRASRDRLDQLNNEIEELRKLAQESSKQEREVKDALTTRRIDCERLTSERDFLNQNTFERYGLQLGEYASQPETMEQVLLLRSAGEEKLNEISNEVLLLKEKIRKLGEVNTGAIEEYDALVDRYTFLTTQKSDLEKSIADLQSTIDRINSVSTERFKRAFDEVNTHFVRVFPVIFGGGHAQLMLTNPEDILETGVDIMAQPPGKKAQNINLLSGGEKTLTAISLLFAIFLVKPSPFCLLDEVDAPLDDANIGRFNALLKEMAKRSQFIIITHNKRTMELNDKLYGVTMEDAGVSKMVSIQVGA